MVWSENCKCYFFEAEKKENSMFSFFLHEIHEFFLAQGKTDVLIFREGKRFWISSYLKYIGICRRI